MFKCYRQIEHSDCGLTCIRMIAKHYGVRIPAKHLKSITDINRLGMSIRDMTECFDRIGMYSKAVQIKKEYLASMPLPAILYWQQRHFVVLYKYTKNKKSARYHIADPAQGRISYQEEDFIRYWIPQGCQTGVAILAEPNDDFLKHTYDKPEGLKKFFLYLYGFLSSHISKFVLAMIITVILMVIDFAIPLILKSTIDDGIGLKNVNLIVTLLLTQFAIAIGGLMASNGLNLLITKTGLDIHLDMVDNFLERLARFPLSFFDRKVSSDFVRKLEDHSRIKDFLLTFPNSMLTMCLNMLVFSILLLHYSSLIFTLFILISGIEVIWNTAFLNRRKSIDYAYFTNLSENQNHAYELTNGMADLKVNNAESSRIGKWKDTQKEINRITLKSSLTSMAQGGGHDVISRLKDLTVTGIGAVMVISGDMSIGTLMTLGYITGRLAQPFSTLGKSIQSLQEAYISYQRIDDVIHDDTEVCGTEKFSEASITFSDVSFKYPGASSPYVIKDLDIIVEKGKVTALVGESGCGKSTLIKLMLGFYKPQKGTIKLSGIDVRDIDGQDWLRHCGVVMQEARIFSGTILDNICMSDSCPDEKKAREILETVELSDFIKKLPMGMSTKIGVAGIEMSGGQRQRLMIARALYKNPDLLFLDEATSSLDANNERTIVSNINIFGKGKTIVIAAHRLSTVQTADRIVYIKAGRIAETGTHQQLLDLKGDYWRLVKNQLQLSTS
ncbi:MAG: peptidase domain-containing ABC transporter [Bacteroides sp.]|nr:peptidase domain-containing ABC transporter [Bacteroides sp.]